VVAIAFTITLRIFILQQNMEKCNWCCQNCCFNVTKTLKSLILWIQLWLWNWI